MSKNNRTALHAAEISTRKAEYVVEGMDCADCALHVEREVSKLPGIQKVSVNVVTGKMEVHHGSSESDGQALESAVRRAGYRLRTDETRQENYIVSRPISTGQLDKIRAQRGIREVVFDPDRSELQVKHEMSPQDIRILLQNTGIQTDLKKPLKIKSSFSNINILHLLISGLSVVLAYAIGYLAGDQVLARIFILCGILAGSYPLIWRGLKEVRARQLGMNFLMTSAVTGALFIGEWNEAAMVVFLFILAQWLEARTMEKARRSIGSLLDQKPRMARRIIEQKEQLIPVEDIEAGDMVAVKPGEFIPLDGVVVSGNSFADQSTITGESMPVMLKKGVTAYAGTLNKNGYIEIEVSRIFNESTYAQIADIVAEAQSKKAPKQIFVEKFSRIYTPVVIGTALFIAFVVPATFGMPFIEWIYRALVLLVIACPCAFVISTPVTIVSALTNALRNGILIKGGVFLEEFARIKSMAFDKTGTITEGNPSVQDIHSLENYTAHDVLTVATALEMRADHPIATAIVAYGRLKEILIPEAKNVTVIDGKGVEGEINGAYYLVGNHLIFEEKNLCDSRIHARLDEIEDANHTAILVGNKDMVFGVISVADSVRANALQMTEELKGSGLSNLFLLTGDNLKTATEIARQVRIDNVHADLLPKAKMDLIKQIRKEHGPVAMLGDGVNDAPALAVADIGIAMGASGSDTAIQTADIALMQNDLLRIPYLKKLSQKTVRIVKQNIFLALFLKFAFLVLAIPGLATLWMAVFADMGASLIVIFNGLRILRFR